MDHLAKLPTSPDDISAGQVLVHNHVYPVARRPGTRGSRCWLQVPDDRLEPCPCIWASELGTHYRVAGVVPRGQVKVC
jgi:hypothetical protein